MSLTIAFIVVMPFGLERLRGIAQAVADTHHAGNVTGPVHDLVTKRGGCQSAGKLVTAPKLAWSSDGG